MKKHNFLGANPITVLDFLASFVKEANIQEISEDQAVVVLPSFLKGLVQTEFDSVVEVIAQGEDNGAASWPDTVQYLLTSYAQPAEISTAIHDLRITRQ